MTSDLSYAASGSIREKDKSSKNIEKSLKRLFLIAAVILSAELIWLFVISPFIPFSTIEIRGFAELDRREVLHLAGITDRSSFMSTNVKEARSKLSANIMVEQVEVIKRFPDKLSIFLVPRQAAAVTLSKDGLRHKMIYVDRNGVFFKTEEEGSEVASLPVISGIENPQLGMKLPSALVSLVKNISVIADDSPELLAAISEIRIERKVWDGYELVLFPVHSPIRVRVENNLSGDVLRFMMLILNVFEPELQKPKEIDFRSGIGSYRIKEQPAW